MATEKAAAVNVAKLVDGAVVHAFQASLQGELLSPEDGGYDDARRVWNAMADRHPALIARCSNATDVIAAVEFARSHGLQVAVRGGGHSMPGHSVCEGGLVIDLSRMRAILVDPQQRIARAEGGALLADLDREAQAFGLATTAGVVSHTGIAGLTLGGGQGWLMGMHGLTIDNLLSVDMVTAGGQLLTASATENQDLYWAVRGGGGNFGVVTSFEYRLHPVGPTIFGGMLLYPMSHAREVLRFYDAYFRSTPDEMMALGGLMTSPDGAPVVALVLGWFGPLAERGPHLEPLAELGPPLADLTGEMPYLQLQSLLDAAVPHGMYRYAKMGYLPAMDEGFIDRTLEHVARVSSPFTFVLLNSFKGAAARVAPDATAFPHRREQIHFDIVSQWTDGAETDTHVRWARAFWSDVEPFTRGVGANFMDADEGQPRVREAYGANYARLVAIKNRYDPTNFFRLNTNVVPSA